MLVDRKNICTGDSGQAIANGTAVVSTDSIDLGVAKRIGGGNPLHPWCRISASGHADNTIEVEVIGADDAALTSNVVALCKSASIAIAAAGVPHVIPMPGIPTAHTKKRYLGFRFDTAGTTPTATAEAGFAETKQSEVI